MKRTLKIFLAGFIIIGVVASLLGCGSDSTEDAIVENQIYTVGRGDLAIEITAVGNLTLSASESLAFEVSGTVEEILVEVGDSVEEGQLLARLDASEWQDYLETLESQIETKQRDLLQLELNITNAEIALENAIASLDEISTAEYEEAYIAQAEIDVKNAETALDQAQDSYDRAEDRYNMNWTVIESIRDLELKTAQLVLAELDLAEAEETLVNALTDIGDMISDKELDIAKKQKELSIAHNKIEDNYKAIAEAQDELDEAEGESIEIIAPFDGFVTRVDADDGAEVSTGMLIIELADSSKFEVDILVSEIDIFQVSLDGEAWVEVDALEGLTFPAMVTHISPTATIQSGVVNYEVKVELQSLEAIAQEQQTSREEAMQGLAEGKIPEQLQQAIDAGFITEEQVEAMIERMKSGEMPFQPGEDQDGMFGGTTEGQQRQAALNLPETFEIREGLTITVSIIVEERTAALLVPNSAITSQGGRTYVNVVLSDGTTEERAITAGISDWQYTEVTSGLIEGDQVVVTGTTSTTTSTTEQQQGVRMPFFGGGARQ
ncbi:efflux RND transporter periplasmic adaptor subunit [Chloroflexota bacterium]